MRFLWNPLGSTVAGFGAAAVTVLLVSNPIGWGTAIVLAVGTAGASYLSGKLATWAYTAWVSPIDFVNGTGVSQVCR